MLLIAALVLLLALPSPWGVLAFAVLLVLFIGEVLYWWRKVRDRRVQAGPETLPGTLARVVSPCRPDGHVALNGELWNARCPIGADAGETVMVVGREGLVLVVEPQRSA